ncbi:hypothetical protein ACVW0P_002982 [Mucilaginibacter sp. UYNi724]
MKNLPYCGIKCFTMILRLFIVFLFVSGMVSAQKKQVMFPPPVLGMHFPEFIDFCKVPEHKKELVYTRFYYSGTDEYWSIYSMEKQCNSVKAELDIPENVERWNKYKHYFKEIHDHYWDRYLIIDAVGTYDDSNKTGYGHLGTNPANFVVKYLVDVQQVIKVKKKNSSKPSSR